MRHIVPGGATAIDDETFVLWVEYYELELVENVQLEEIAIVLNHIYEPISKSTKFKFIIGI